MKLSKEALAVASLRIDGLTKYVGECMVWIGYLAPPDKRGYQWRPRLTILHHGKRMCFDARRLRWASVHGWPPPGFVVRMTCGNPLCLNPDHMRLGTRAEVARESMRSPLFVIRRTIANRKSRGKITLEDARAIRASSEPGKALAERYGVSHQLICAIRKGLAWPDYALNGLAAR